MTDAQRRGYLLLAIIWLVAFNATIFYGEATLDGVRTFAQTARYNIHQAYHQRFNRSK
jgi:hypothetical protein